VQRLVGNDLCQPGVGGRDLFISSNQALGAELLGNTCLGSATPPKVEKCSCCAVVADVLLKMQGTCTCGCFSACTWNAAVGLMSSSWAGSCSTGTHVRHCKTLLCCESNYFTSFSEVIRRVSW